jgi:hypothetical protein
MERETPFWRTSPFWLLIAILSLVAALIFLGGRYRDVTVGMDIVPKVMSRKTAALSGIKINMIKSVEAEKSAVMANTDEDSIRFAEESRHASEAAEKSRQELTELIGTYPSVPEKELLTEFDSGWKEFRQIDQQVLEFAIQNTNLKAARLSFGAANTAMNEFGHALSGLISDSTSGPICRMIYEAQTAALKIHVLHAPHIASPDDHEMEGIEESIRQNDAVVRKALSDIGLLLPPAKKGFIQPAEAAYDAFMDFTDRILEWSRQNTNIKSFELSLNRKRKITAQCEEILTKLQDAIQSRTFKATR